MTQVLPYAFVGSHGPRSARVFLRKPAARVPCRVPGSTQEYLEVRDSTESTSCAATQISAVTYRMRASTPARMHARLHTRTHAPTHMQYGVRKRYGEEHACAFALPSLAQAGAALRRRASALVYCDLLTFLGMIDCIYSSSFLGQLMFPFFFLHFSRVCVLFARAAQAEYSHPLAD